MKVRRKLAIVGALLLAVAVVEVYVGAILMTQYQVQSNVIVQYPPTIKMNIYADQGYTQTVTVIDWGTLQPGGTAEKLVYVRNEGDVAFTLALSTENWNPATAQGYMTLKWNYTGTVIQRSQIAKITLRLDVLTGASAGSFSFTIVITATEA